MAFEEQLPEWEAEGTQPPKTKRVEGWQPTEKPPAAWFNWLFNRTYKVLRELQQKAAEKEDVQLALQTAQQAEQTANQAASDLASHLNETVTGIVNVVTAFGAVGDGITPAADSIQRAIDSLPPEGGVIYVPPGTYLLEKTILLPSNIRFVGSGRTTVLKGDFGSYVDPVLIGLKGCTTATGYDAVENVVIEGIAIDSPITNGIGLAHGKNIVIRNIYGVRIYWHYVDIAGCQNVLCENLYLMGGADNPAFQIDNLSGDGGLKVFDGTTEINANVDGTGTDGVILTKSVIQQDNQSYPIHLHRSGGKNIVIRDCKIIGGMHGIYQDVNTAWENILIDGVTFINQTERCVWLRERVDNPLERNKKVKIRNCHCLDFGYQGIVIDGWEDVLIDGCTITGLYRDSQIGPAYTNISVWNCDRAIVSNILITGENKSPYGIRVVQNSQHVIIANCIIKNANIGLLVNVNSRVKYAGVTFVNVTTQTMTESGGAFESYPIS